MTELKAKDDFFETEHPRVMAILKLLNHFGLKDELLYERAMAQMSRAVRLKSYDLGIFLGGKLRLTFEFDGSK